MQRTTELFTPTVTDYVKYRPSYPKEVLKTLIDECHLTKNSVIADVGSGTGLLSKLFLDYGSQVYGVEPNEAMRKAAEIYLISNPNFKSINGTAEETSLKNDTIDLITVGTAFHWFDPDKTKAEFKRILKSRGFVLLVWNVRNIEQSDFLKDYEKIILEYCPSYSRSNPDNFDITVVERFFSPHKMKECSFPNTQQFDWDGIKGRLASTSYSLRPGDTNYDEMVEKLKSIYEKHQKNNYIEYLYDTKMYFGHLR